MNWNRAVGITGVIGATVCGVCLTKTCTKSNRLIGSVSAESAGETPSASASSNEKLAGLTLKQVHVYFRHGARTPLHVMPGLEEVAYTSDLLLRIPGHLQLKHEVVFLPDMKPRGDYSDYEEHYKQTHLKGGGYAGNLTTYGQEQMYNLGLKLRRSYLSAHGLLPDGYQPEDVFVQSTNINRTIMSACCVLTGMFGKEDLNKKGPVVIPVSMTEDEVLFPNPHVCSVLKKANHAAMIHFDNIPGIKEDRLLIENVIGYKSENKLNFVLLRDDLIARSTHGYSIPEHIQPYMEMIDRNATKILYFAMCGQHDVERPIITRLAAGPALSLMMEAMEKGRRGLRTPKVYLYSMHDSSLLALLEAVGLFDWKWPPFAADLRLEMYQDKAGEHWVRILYLGQERTMRGCSGPVCRFSEFQQNLKPYVIARGAEYDQICGSDILEQIAASLLQHDSGEVETPEIKETSEIPAGM